MKTNAVKRILIGISVLFVTLMLVLPLLVVIFGALKEGLGEYISAVSDAYTVKALVLTIKATVAAVVINTLFGIFAAWAITKYHFRGKKLLITFVDIPFAVSPVIAGLIYLLNLEESAGRMTLLLS